MKIAALVAVAGLIGLGAPFAVAQDVTLYCMGEEALVRLDQAPLPAGDKSRWTKVKAAEGNRCRLASGAEVIVRARQTQGTPFGMGGANREAVFSLWVDRKKVISRVQHWPHTVAQAHEFTMNHALYSPGAVHLCWYERGEMDPAKTAGVTCERRKVDLAGLPVDPLEPEDNSKLGTITFATGYSTDFCESLITRKTVKREARPDGRYVQIGRSRDGDEIILGKSGQFIPFEADSAVPLRDGNSGARQRLAYFDLHNTGSPQTVIEYIGESGAFWGNFLMYHDGVVSDDELQEYLKISDTNSYDPEALETKTGWRLLRIEYGPWKDNGRYRTFVPVIIAGKTFLFVESFFQDDRPELPLYLPLPDHRVDRFDTVCTFQRIDPNL